MEFYKRNYIEGLFLSSGIIQNSDYTMEQLIAVAKSSRVKSMIAKHEGFAETAAQFMPSRETATPLDIDSLRQAAACCQACDLHQQATQTVFGVGPTNARIMSGRGKVRVTEWCNRTLATWHLAAILRAPDAGRRDEMMQQCVDDLRVTSL